MLSSPAKVLKKTANKSKPVILLVDDNGSDRELFKIALNECGKTFVLNEADRVEAALKILENTVPDVIIADINMPGTGGFEMVAHLKKDPKLKKIPVFIWSSSSRDSDIAMSNSKGAQAYFIKPDSYEMLLKQTCEIFDKIQQQPSDNQ